MSRRFTRLTVILASLALVGCGSSAASPAGSTSGGDGEAHAYEALYAELEGLSVEEREARLLELAQEADAPVSLYADAELGDSAQMLGAFSDKYDIDVEIYDGSTESVRDRLLQESEADFQSADVVELDAFGMHVISEAGLLAAVETPYAEFIGPAGRSENWTAIRYSLNVSGWNTDGVDSAPTDLRDLAGEEWAGRMGLEDSAVYWFAAIVRHWEETEGMTEEEAVEVFRQIAANSQLTSGTTATADFLTAGQFDLSPNVLAHRIMQLQADGAPVEWQPAVQPVVAEPTAIALLKNARNPAGGLLYLDWVLSETGGQQVFVEQQRTPAHVDVSATIVGDVEPIDADFEAIANDFEKWSTLWDEVVRTSGS